MKKIPVAILGSTGTVGQRFIQLLNHPWFVIQEVCASETHVGKKYKDAVNWMLTTPIPQDIADLVIRPSLPPLESKIIFSALDSSVAGDIETMFAQKGHVIISNAKNHRMDNDVPLLIPEINPEHLLLIEKQKNKNNGGFIVTNPNCTTIGLTMVLKPLHDAFGVKQVLVHTLQAISGAGYPGLSSLDILDNVIPYIPDEEDKIETEPLKLLAHYENNVLIHPSIQISAQCNRVAVRDGHIENITIAFDKNPSVEDVIQVLSSFTAEPQQLQLPSAPQNPIIYRKEENRPQPLLDRESNKGMSVVVGRAAKSNILDIKLTLLVHNSIRGAAGAAILNAEFLKRKNYL